MKLPKILRGAPAADETPRRRRRRPRADAPTTIVPIVGADETPSWLTPRPSSPIAVDLDAARERLRRQIPPVDDED